MDAPVSKAIEVNKLSKSFGKHKAVDSITFAIEPHRVTGFLGPNGAGKTTTLRMILGLIAPSSGSAYVMGETYLRVEDPAHVVGALLDTEQFHPQRSGRNHLRVLAAAGKLDPARVDEVLTEVDLMDAADRRVGTYSLGMRQRLGLAAAMLGDPQILILDEPANGLDPAGIRWLRGFLRSYAARGRAVFVSSHLLAEISQIADEVVVIDHGRFVAQAPVDDLVARAAVGMRVSTTLLERLRDELTAAGIEAMQVSDSDLVVSADAETVWAAAVRTGVPLTGLQEERRSLEEVFFELTGNESRGAR